jgi:microcystin-dependent protein
MLFATGAAAAARLALVPGGLLYGGASAPEYLAKPSVASLLRNTNTGVPDYLALTALYSLLMPVGTIYTSGVSTNPATLFGFGTWTAIAGRVIVGIDATQTEFDTAGETGGAKTHALTSGENGPHSHPIATATAVNAGGDVGDRKWPSSGDNTGSSGSGTPHNNLQPYIVKYIWERTA